MAEDVWAVAVAEAVAVLAGVPQAYGPNGGWHPAALVLMRALTPDRAKTMVTAAVGDGDDATDTKAYVWPLREPNFFGVFLDDGSTHVYRVLKWNAATVMVYDGAPVIAGGNDVALIHYRQAIPLFA